ncbi:hypothetical protein AB4160_16075 [Shewanella sp. 10N.286.51.B8]|uniref:hypothetical protein n=1 Tax=Shewanella sp. 10N.286.51.B8 TaxID=3229708 RepID=UPI00354CC8B5
MAYNTYSDLQERYQKDRKTIWRWWAKDFILEPPKRVGSVLLGWTDEQLERFENGGGK